VTVAHLGHRSGGAWDAINEAVIMPVFGNEPHPTAITRLARDRGRVATVRLAFEEATPGRALSTLHLEGIR
jgi:hypothetical protein